MPMQKLSRRVDTFAAKLIRGYIAVVKKDVICIWRFTTKLIKNMDVS
jgi:hypothetical protein